MALFDLFKKKKEEEFRPPGPPPSLPPFPPTAAGFGESRVPAPEVLAAAERAAAPPRGAPPGAPPLPPGMPPPPPPPSPPERLPARREPTRLLTEDIEAITEAIVAERWKDLTKDFQSLLDWKDQAQKKFEQLEKSLDELKHKLDTLESSIFGKLEEYSKGVADVSSEVQAIHRIFKEIMPQFTESVQELSDLVSKMKKRRR